MRLVKKGPLVAARIECNDGKWVATINGEVQFPAHEDPVLAGGVLDIWHHAATITEAEYNYLITRKEWAEKHDPDSPAANPRRPIDLSILRPVYS